MKNVLLMACAATLVLTGCGSDNPHSYNTTTKPTTSTVKPNTATSAHTAELNEMVRGKDMFYGVRHNKFGYGGHHTPFDYIHKIQADDHQVKTAKYEGTAMVRVGTGPLVKGTSAFDVNFGNAVNGGTVSGEIKYGNETVKLQNGRIGYKEHNNSKFAGKDGNVQFEGTFFGNTASELGGSFKDGTREGSFGASKK